MKALKSCSEPGNCRKRVLFVLGILVFSFLIFAGRTAEYIVSEFISCNHRYVTMEPCSNCYNHVRNLSMPHKVPKTIHQIFFFETSDTLPQKLVNGQQSWLRHHPDYTYILWNKTSVNHLIDNEYPFLKNLYHSYGHWVRRADVARYVVLYHYGGWYVDLDVICKNSVKTLQNDAYSLNKTVIVRETEPWGFSNDFIGITPKHPFLYSVLTSLDKSNRWYIFPYANTMFSTGPLFLWGRYLNYPEKNHFYMINNSTYSKYLHLLHNSSWHSWDGVIVWFFFKDTRVFLIFLSSLSVLLCVVLIVIKFRSSFSSSICKNIEASTHKL